MLPLKGSFVPYSVPLYKMCGHSQQRHSIKSYMHIFEAMPRVRVIFYTYFYSALCRRPHKPRMSNCDFHNRFLWKTLVTVCQCRRAKRGIAKRAGFTAPFTPIARQLTAVPPPHKNTLSTRRENVLPWS